MPVTLGLRFPWGRYHATPWGRNVNEGIPEWPPSPWRVIRALYATWQNRMPDIDSSIVEAALGRLTGPPAFRLPAHVEAHTRHYMPDETFMTAVKESRDRILDPFVVVPTDEEVLLRWAGEPAPAETEVLALLSSGLTYLGRAESICHARLITDPPIGEWLEAASEDEPEVARVLIASSRLDLSGVIERPSLLRQRRRIVPSGAEWVDYPRPLPLRPQPSRRPVKLRRVTAIRFALATTARPSRRAAVAMTHALRQACMSRYGRTGGERRSASLAGKSAEGDVLTSQHLHAHYLAFGSPEDPRLDALAVWAPGGLDDDEVRAVAGLRSLQGWAHVSDFRPSILGLEAVGHIEQAAPELVGPASVWMSFTPYAPTRHPARGSTLVEFLTEDVTRELGYRGKPNPAGVEVLRGDWLSYRRHRPTGRDTRGEARRAFGIRLVFPEPVAGPISLGDLAHFGLGLFLPHP
ncbi:MAG: type I-G CRISPR-associated protein Csb2 [Acidimicrobiia bacterium]